MSIREMAIKGLPIDNVLIIDSHDHLGRWHDFYIPQGGTVEQMVSSMDNIGIDKICVTAHSSIGPDYIYGNNLVFEALRKFPDRVFGYVTVNPNYPEDMQHELDRCFANELFKGIKLHPALHGRAVDYTGYKAAYEEADKRGCPILIHIWGSDDLAKVESLSAVYTNAKFIMGHSGGDTTSMVIAAELINKRDNVYGDFAVSGKPEGNVEWFVKEVGSKKLLFGSDMPFYDPRPTFCRIALSNISEEAKMDILGLNMARLLKLKI